MMCHFHLLCAAMGDWVVLAGSFARAGAVNVNNVAAWDSKAGKGRGENRLVCMGQEVGRSACPSPDFCCQVRLSNAASQCLYIRI
jgi:hypothetical protein